MPTSLPELPDITEVEPFGEQDRACFEEVRAVLERHGALNRFGLTLLHSHFPVGDDEILVESVDPETRTLVTRPRKTSEPRKAVETSWRLDDPTGLQQCETLCNVIPAPPGQPDLHEPTHYTTG